MFLNGVTGLGSWSLNGEGGYERHERQYLSFIYRIRHNSLRAIEHHRQHREFIMKKQKSITAWSLQKYINNQFNYFVFYQPSQRAQ